MLAALWRVFKTRPLTPNQLLRARRVSLSKPWLWAMDAMGIAFEWDEDVLPRVSSCGARSHRMVMIMKSGAMNNHNC